MNLNISSWKKFYIKDLFEITRGKRIVKCRDYIKNEDNKNIYRVITAKTTNNGIDGYYSKYNCEGNVITSCGEVSGMISFYQEDKCWVLDTVRILKPKFNNLNKYVALFMIPMLNKWSCLFNYANKAKPSDIEKLFIKLPVDANGDPDWSYMENYIKYIIKKNNLDIIELSKSSNNNHYSLNVSTWKEFRIQSILTKAKIKSISTIIRTFNDGSINVVGNSTINNGIIKKLDIRDSNYIHNSNTLSYGAKGGFFFWQEEPWASTDHVHMFENKKLNKYSALFLCSILNKLISIKGGWSSSLESNIVYETIKLPVDANGDPDWSYMENYIKSLPYSKYL